MSLVCDLCQNDLTHEGQFVLLNRAGVGSDGSTSFIELRGQRSGAYMWDHEARNYSGRVYCFPACLHTALEALLVEKRYMERTGG